MSDFKATFDQARNKLRHKLGFPALSPPDVEHPAASSDGSSSGVSVLHRVLAFEDHKQAPDACDPTDSDVIPLPAALSHSLSGTWKQRFDSKGKPVWQRDAREAASTEVGSLCPAACCTIKLIGAEPAHVSVALLCITAFLSGIICEHKLTLQVTKESAPVPKQPPQQPSTVHLQEGCCLAAEPMLAREGQLLLQLPQVHSLQQAKQQSDALQLQAYQQTRKLQGTPLIALSCSCRCYLPTYRMNVQQCRSAPVRHLCGLSGLRVLWVSNCSFLNGKTQP